MEGGIDIGVAPDSVLAERSFAYEVRILSMKSNCHSAPRRGLQKLLSTDRSSKSASHDTFPPAPLHDLVTPRRKAREEPLGLLELLAGFP